MKNIKKFSDLNEAEKEKVEWKSNNWTANMPINYPPQKGSLTEQFLKFVFENPGKTRKDFYKHIDREYTPGNNSLFFAQLNQAGIVELVGSKYYLGANYGKWTQGLLKKASGR